jgi:DNA-binding transcriptional MocR family regulator
MTRSLEEDMTMEDFRYRQIEQQLQQQIVSGTLGPGARLPSLRHVSARSRVAVSTVLQAYAELERKGIIESRPRSGFFVCRDTRELPPTPRAPRPLLRPHTINRSQLIAAVLETVGDRELLPLGINCPADELLPYRELARVASRLSREDPKRLVGYLPVEGSLALRRQLSLRAAQAGLAVRPEEIIITCGALEALHVAVRSLVRPGDNVLIQAPSYFCFQQLLENQGVRSIEIPSHPRHGVDPADVDQALGRFDIRACIFTPNFNNPDGSLTPDAAKQEIVELLAAKNIPLIEDDVAGDLHFGPARPTVFKMYDAKGLVILCSSFSKTLCPGYRIGWIMPGRFFPRAYEVKATTNVCSATPTQEAVALYLREGRYDRHLRGLRRTLQEQTRSMQLLVSRAFPEGSRVSRPQGGGVLWVELPGGLNSVELMYRAREEGISIAPGTIFSTQDRFVSHVRLNSGGLWSADLVQGVERLGALIRDMG